MNSASFSICWGLRFCCMWGNPRLTDCGRYRGSIQIMRRHVFLSLLPQMHPNSIQLRHPTLSHAPPRLWTGTSASSVTGIDRSPLLHLFLVHCPLLTLQQPQLLPEVQQYGLSAIVHQTPINSSQHFAVDSSICSQIRFSLATLEEPNDQARGHGAWPLWARSSNALSNGDTFYVLWRYSALTSAETHYKDLVDKLLFPAVHHPWSCGCGKGKMGWLKGEKCWGRQIHWNPHPAPVYYSWIRLTVPRRKLHCGFQKVSGGTPMTGSTNEECKLSGINLCGE